VSQDNSWFEADLAAPSNENHLATLRISGNIVRMTKVPVLRESLNSGNIIGANDIDYIDLPEKNLKTNIVLNPAQIIGMTPRQMVVAGQPVQSNQIGPPKMIDRGDTVTMVFNQNGLELTAQGKALEDGTKGDQIRIMNISSNKIIVAQVTNNKEVTIQTF
jgi:flagella basal body P-ring formation protein FlgA